jgi:hypothetical protein
MGLVALAIKYESPGPVLDRYEWVGIGGRRFKLLSDPDHPTSWGPVSGIEHGANLFVHHRTPF